MKLNKNTKICIFGLGYVGLPLAIAFEKYFSVIGYDINLNRINSLKKHIDITEEVTKTALVKAKSIKFTSNKKDIKILTFLLLQYLHQFTNQKHQI